MIRRRLKLINVNIYKCKINKILLDRKGLLKIRLKHA